MTSEPSSRWLASLLLVAAVGIASGCGSASPTPRSDGDTPSPVGVSPSNRGAPAIASRVVRRSYVHLPVPSADLTDLVRVRGNTIEALADRGAFFGQVYPVISTDDGGDWSIDGPRFYRAAANGADGVDHLGVTAHGTLVAWAKIATMVRTRAYGARHWRETGFDSGVRTVTISGRRMIVATYARSEPATPSTTYVSSDEGLSWQRT